MPDLVVTPAAFRSHCQLLARKFDVLPLSEAVERYVSSESSRPVAAITFDDGYRDNYEHAAPILDTSGLRATFYVVSDLVGAEGSTWYDRLARAVQGHSDRSRLTSILRDAALDMEEATPAAVVQAAKTLDADSQLALIEALGSRDAAIDRLMDPAQLLELQSAGHEIGSHTRSHAILPRLSDEDLRAELAGSRVALEELLGRAPRAFCYPNGDHDQRTANAVAAAGYTSATTMEPGINEPAQDPLRLKRWFIHEGRLTRTGGKPSRTLLRMELTGLASRLFGRDRPRHPPRRA